MTKDALANDLEGLIAGTAETDALAADLARCGQAPFGWLDDEQLGDVTGWGESKLITQAAMSVIVAQAEMELPRPTEHDVLIKQFSYITQDRGELVEATALAGFPTDTVAGDELDIVLFLHGFSGLNDGCAPSANLTYQVFAALIASYGYVVVMPDYAGMKSFGEPSEGLHPAAVGHFTATTVLDSLRAAHKMTAGEREGICLNTPRFAVVGASQGGHAALWTERLAPYYAREFEFVGGVASTPLVDSVRQTETAIADGGGRVGVITGAISGLFGWHGVDISAELLPPFDTTIPAALETECVGTSGYLTEVLGDALASEIYSPTVFDAATSGTLGSFDPWGCALTESGLTTTLVARIDGEAAPLLYLVGGLDETLLPGLQRDSFDTLCSQGAVLEYAECADAGHVATNMVGFDTIVEYVEARLAGEPLGEPCVQRPPENCRR